MAQSRLHGVSTIYNRLEGLLKVGAIPQSDAPIWLAVYARFPPKRPPDQERPLVQKPLRPILYPEDNIRAQFFKMYQSSEMTNLANAESFAGGWSDVFLQSYEAFERMRPEWHSDDIWHLTLKWMEEELALTLKLRGELVDSKEREMTAATLATRFSNMKTVDVEEMKTFLEKVEASQLLEEEERTEQTL